jgi:hypothetical protein
MLRNINSFMHLFLVLHYSWPLVVKTTSISSFAMFIFSQQLLLWNPVVATWLTISGMRLYLVYNIWLLWNICFLFCSNTKGISSELYWFQNFERKWYNNSNSKTCLLYNNNFFVLVFLQGGIIANFSQASAEGTMALASIFFPLYSDRIYLSIIIIFLLH